jgi:hypothetical protein
MGELKYAVRVSGDFEKRLACRNLDDDELTGL